MIWFFRFCEKNHTAWAPSWFLGIYLCCYINVITQAWRALCKTSYHIDELRKLEFYFNGEGVCDVDHWTNQLVVIRQEVVVQSLRVWISWASWENTKKQTSVFSESRSRKQKKKDELLASNPKVLHPARVYRFYAAWNKISLSTTNIACIAFY